MSAERLGIDEMIAKIDDAWRDFQASFEGLDDERMLVPGVTGTWSVTDILAHVAVWDAFSLERLPGILTTREHGTHVDTDDFNARMTEAKRGLSLDEVRQELEATHQRLLDYLRGVEPDAVAGNDAFVERLAADTWGHYPDHASAIRVWRERRT